MNARTKIVKNIQTSISGDEAGSLVILWDLLTVELPNANPEKEWWEPDTNENRSVKNIRLVEIQLFDKIGVDITSAVKRSSVTEDLVKGKLLSWAGDKTVAELEKIAHEPA